MMYQYLECAACGRVHLMSWKDNAEMIEKIKVADCECGQPELIMYGGTTPDAWLEDY